MQYGLPFVVTIPTAFDVRISGILAASLYWIYDFHKYSTKAYVFFCGTLGFLIYATIFLLSAHLWDISGFWSIVCDDDRKSIWEDTIFWWCWCTRFHSLREKSIFTDLPATKWLIIVLLLTFRMHIELNCNRGINTMWASFWYNFLLVEDIRHSFS